MQSDDQYIDKPDDFSRKVGEKLREHQMPVGPDVWDSLTGKFPPQKKRMPPFLPWAAVGVAVVALVLFFLTDVFNPEQEKVRELVDISDVREDRGLAEIAEPMEVPGPSTESSKPGEVQKSAQVSIPPLIALSEKKHHPEKVGVSEETQYQEVVTELTAMEEPEEIKVQEKVTKDETVITSETKILPEDEFLAENQLSVPPQEHLTRRGIMAALGGGTTPLDFLLMEYDADGPVYDFLPGGGFGTENGLGSGSGYNLLKPGDYTDIVHHLPLSFSLTANFPVSNNLALETGLSYTYLFSRFKRNDQLIYRATLQQHYIGIPVNLRYITWENDAWSIYLLGGASIEKGLRSIYKQEIEQNGGIVYHTKVYSGIDGFQFSAQGGAGFSYRLHNNLDLFGEPRIVYYFKNNQPMSARTENPLIFGLNIGIRLQFK